MRTKYKIPDWVRKNVTNELYHYWDNVKLLEELKEEILEASPDGMPKGNMVGSHTESKVMKLNSRAILVIANKIMQIENVQKMLNDNEREIFDIIFKDRMNQVRAYTKKNISYNMYYIIKQKIIQLTALEMGYIID